MTTTIERPKSIALVDFSYLFKKNYVVLPGAAPLAAAKQTLAYLAELRAGVDHLVLCLDAPPYHRKAVFPDYKAGRPEVEPEEKAQKKWLQAECKRLGYQTAWSKGYEADDVIATLAHIYGEWCADVRIVANDKDAAQCVTANVVQFVPPFGKTDWEIRTAEKVKEKFGVTPEQMPLFQALCGDKSDNVPGVPRVGEVRAADLVSRYKTLAGLAAAMAEGAIGKTSNAVWDSLAKNWNQLVVSLELVTLSTSVPLDAEGLLMKLTPEPAQTDDMGVELDNFQPNSTPMPESAEAEAAWAREQDPQDKAMLAADEPAKPQPRIGKDPKADEVLAAASRERVERAAAEARARIASGENDESGRQSPEGPRQTLTDKQRALYEHERQRVTDAEFDPISRAPGDKAAAPAQLPAPRPAATTPTPAPELMPLVKAKPDYGLVDENLQPKDLRSAEILSKWLASGEMYPQFKTPTQIFTVISRGKELGIGMNAALSTTHIVEGKPVSHADLIRALAERDPNCEYLMPIEFSPTRCVWEGKHRKQPRPVQYAYSIEDAKAAGLVRTGAYGKGGNWTSRPQDMLMKTAGSKLARLLWPGATLGLYCPEELSDKTMEELNEAAA
jgi:DNA polymerase-1